MRVEQETVSMVEYKTAWMGTCPKTGIIGIGDMQSVWQCDCAGQDFACWLPWKPWAGLQMLI